MNAANDLRPLVSVIMPAYNAAETIWASMRSVLSQDYRNIELIVVDDCSRDGTLDLMDRIADHDTRARPVRLASNQGVAHARNAGIESATGQFIAFLDSDDCWHPGKLSAQMTYLQAADASIGYASYQRIDTCGRVLSIVVPPARVSHAQMLRSNHIGNLTAIYDRRIGDGRFEKRGHEDYAFWLQMIKRAGHAFRLPGSAPVASYLVRPGSLSSGKLKAAHWQWRIYREVEHLGPVDAGWNFMHYIGNAMRKRRPAL